MPLERPISLLRELTFRKKMTKVKVLCFVHGQFDASRWFRRQHARRSSQQMTNVWCDTMAHAVRTDAPRPVLTDERLTSKCLHTQCQRQGHDPWPFTRPSNDGPAIPRSQRALFLFRVRHVIALYVCVQRIDIVQLLLFLVDRPVSIVNYFSDVTLCGCKSHAQLDAIGNESVPIQLAQCWFSGLAISNA